MKLLKRIALMLLMAMATVCAMDDGATNELGKRKRTATKHYGDLVGTEEAVSNLGRASNRIGKRISSVTQKETENAALVPNTIDEQVDKIYRRIEAIEKTQNSVLGFRFSRELHELLSNNIAFEYAVAIILTEWQAIPMYLDFTEEIRKVIKYQGIELPIVTIFPEIG